MSAIVADSYPSRVSSRAEILPRVDPVIHSAACDLEGPLMKQQLNAYEQNGFLMLPGFFSSTEVNEALSALESLRQSKEICQRPEAIVEPTSRDLRSLFAVHRIDPFFGNVAYDERFTSIARQLLGSDVYIHQSRINLKPGFAGKEFYWHSDFETWHAEDGMPRMRAVSFSLLLTPNYEFNGPLMLVPGSHRHFVPSVGKTPENHYQSSLRKQEYGVPDDESLTKLVEEGGIQTCTGPAGTLVIFECNTMHGSNSNISPVPRSNLFIVYNSVENQLVEPFYASKPRPEFIATRETVEIAASRRSPDAALA